MKYPLLVLNFYMSDVNKPSNHSNNIFKKILLIIGTGGLLLGITIMFIRVPLLGEWVLAPNIKLGGFELENIPTISEKIVEKADGQKISIAEAEGINEIILGNTVFQNLVLTIDYQKQEIILRDKDSAIAIVCQQQIQNRQTTRVLENIVNW